MESCFKCGAYHRHYKIFSNNKDGLKEVKFICFCANCRNELKGYKNIKSQLIDAEYQLFLLEQENVTQD